MTSRIPRSSLDVLQALLEMQRDLSPVAVAFRLRERDLNRLRARIPEVQPTRVPWPGAAFPAPPPQGVRLTEDEDLHWLVWCAIDMSDGTTRYLGADGMPLSPVDVWQVETNIGEPNGDD